MAVITASKSKVGNCWKKKTAFAKKIKQTVGEINFGSHRLIAYEANG